MHPTPIQPGPGQESVWDYPRPPAIEPTTRRLRIELAGATLIDTTSAYRVLETSHPPVYYLPASEFLPGSLVPAEGGSFCEWKGRAVYYDLHVGGTIAELAAWGYPDPTARFRAIKDHVAVYAGKVDACYVDGVQVVAQPGGFYGGWITPDVMGPFKGGPGSMGW